MDKAFRRLFSRNQWCLQGLIKDETVRQTNKSKHYGWVQACLSESPVGPFFGCMEQNEEITAKFINEKEFQDVVGQALMQQVYDQIREEEQPTP
jgi:hypothetical protein